MAEAALISLKSEQLNAILDKIGFGKKRNTTLKALLGQVLDCLNNNASLNSLEPVDVNEPIDESYFTVPELIKQLRLALISEKHINSILSAGIETIDDLASTIHRLKLPVSTTETINTMCQQIIGYDPSTRYSQPESIPNVNSQQSDQRQTLFELQQSNRNTQQRQRMPELDESNQQVEQQQTLFELQPSSNRRNNNTTSNSIFRDNLRWSDIAPYRLRPDENFFEWLSELEYMLQRFDPSGVTWVEKTELLLTGDARRASAISVSKGYTGQEYLNDLRNNMLSGPDKHKTWLEFNSIKYKIGDDAIDYYRKFHKLANICLPGFGDKELILTILRSLPEELAIKIVHGGGRRGVNQFLEVFSSLSSLLTIKREKRQSQNRNRNDSPNTNNNQIRSAPNNLGRRDNRNNRNRRSNDDRRTSSPVGNQNNNNDHNVNQSQMSQRQAIGNNSSGNSNQRGNNNRYARGRNNYNRNNNQSNTVQPQAALPGTVNSIIPSTPQLNTRYVPSPHLPVIHSPQMHIQPNFNQPQPVNFQHVDTNSENVWIPPATANYVSDSIQFQNCYPASNTVGAAYNLAAYDNVVADCAFVNSYNHCVDTNYQNNFLTRKWTDSIYQVYVVPPNFNSSRRVDYSSTVFATLLNRPNLTDKQAIEAADKSLTNIRNPIPTLQLIFHDLNGVVLKALLDSGSPISIIPGIVADHFHLMTVPCSMNISGVNGRRLATPVRGLTYLKLQIAPNSPVVKQPFYILDCVEEPIILGRDFLRWSELNIQAASNGFTIRRNTNIIIHPTRDDKKLIIAASIPTSTEFAEAAARYTRINVGPPVQASNVLSVYKVNVDPISDVNANFEQTLASRIAPELDIASKNIIWSTIARNIDRFSRHRYDLGKVPYTVCNVTINVPLSRVPRCNPFRYSIERAKVLDDLVNELAEHGIVEPSRAPGAAPAMLVAKKDGSKRMVASFVELNKLIERRCYPIPNIEDFISRVQGYKYFCSLDLSQGFYQIELPPEERQKLAFVTQSGKWQYVMLPMGLTDSPAIFQELMDTVFGELRGKIVLVYMDDILVMAKSIEELARNMQIVFDRLRQFNLKLKGDKCRFGVNELVFLGHLVNGDTVKPDPSKIQTLINQSLPKTMKQLQSFLGFVNHYSRYIPDFSSLVAPLYRLTSKARKFKLERSDQEIISKLKSVLARDCMLAIFNPTAPIRLLVDASNIAVAGILEQQEKGNWRAISYFGQKLTSYQRNYTTQEKECLAVYLCVKKYRHYLEGKPFLVISDHHALCSLSKRSFRLDRLCRWQTALSQFDYKIVYSKGAHHPADCFTRSEDWNHRKTVEIDEDDDLCLPISVDTVEAARLINANFSADMIVDELRSREFDLTPFDDKFRHCQVLKVACEVPFDRNHIRSNQSRDSFCNSVISDLNSKIDSEFSKKFEFVEGILYRLPMKNRKVSRIVLPLSAKDTIIDYYHSGDAGLHFGASKTYELVSQYFWCKDLLEWVRSRVYECEKCNINKKEPRVGNIPNQMPVAEFPMQRLQIDVVGSFPPSRSGNEYIITVLDMHSGYSWAKAVKRTTATDLIKFMKQIIYEKGLPTILHSDNGRNFVSQQFQRFLESQGIKHVRSTYYHPQSQGRVERLNGIVGERLRTSTKVQDLWDEDLPSIIFKLNMQPLSADRPSPFFLMNGFEPRTLSNNLLNVDPPVRDDIATERERANTIRAENQVKSLLSRSKSYIQPRIKFGDIVRTKTIANDRKKGKLADKYSIARYLVIRVNQNSTARLVDMRTYIERTENLARLKKDRGRKPKNYEALISRYKDMVDSGTSRAVDNNNVVDSKLNQD